MTSIAELEEQPRWKNRSIEVMLEIDRIRDSARDEHELATAMLGKLVDAAGAELGLVFQREDESGGLQLRALLDGAIMHDSSMAEAARLCGAAAGGQVLISKGTYDLARDAIMAEEIPPRHLKGIDEEVRCWSVSGLL